MRQPTPASTCFYTRLLYLPVRSPELAPESCKFPSSLLLPPCPSAESFQLSPEASAFLYCEDRRTIRLGQTATALFPHCLLLQAWHPMAAMNAPFFTLLATPPPRTACLITGSKVQQGLGVPGWKVAILETGSWPKPLPHPTGSGQLLAFWVQLHPKIQAVSGSRGRIRA